MLLPTLQRAKGTAHRISCVSVLKEINQASKLYESDYHYFPVSLFYNNGGKFIYYKDLIAPYIGEKKFMKMCIDCYQRRDPRDQLKDGFHQNAMAAKHFAYLAPSYGINSGLVGGYDVGNAKFGNYNVYKSKNPSKSLYIAEAIHRKRESFGFVEVSHPNHLINSLFANDDDSYAKLSVPHFNQTNVLYIDGHVESHKVVSSYIPRFETKLWE